VPRRIDRLDQGRAVFLEGNPETGLPACVSCHRPDGGGIRPDFPRLAGQQPDYIVAQLSNWQAVRGGKGKLMSMIAPLLQRDEIQAVADYLAQLPGGP
jgi:cytochrome c553